MSPATEIRLHVASDYAGMGKVAEENVVNDGLGIAKGHVKVTYGDHAQQACVPLVNLSEWDGWNPHRFSRCCAGAVCGRDARLSPDIRRW